MSGELCNESGEVTVRRAHQGVDAWVGGRIIAREVREIELSAVLAPGATRPFGAIDTDGGAPKADPANAVVPMAVAGPHALWAARSAT